MTQNARCHTIMPSFGRQIRHGEHPDQFLDPVVYSQTPHLMPFHDRYGITDILVLEAGKGPWVS